MALASRLAIIPGGIGGIGSVTGKILRGHGSKLALLYAPFEAGKVASTIKETFGDKTDDVRPYECDVTSPASVKAAFASIEKDNAAFPAFLINSAGYVALSPLEDTTPEDIQRHFNVNLFGPTLTGQAFARIFFAARQKMADNGTKPYGGRIVNIASQAAHIALHHHGAYCASKAGVLGLTRCQASEWGPRGITANSISPGPVWTQMGKDAWADREAREAYQASVPTGIFAEPEEVARIVEFLVLDKALNINGADIRLDVDTGDVQVNATRNTKRWYSIQTKAYLEQSDLLYKTEYEPWPDHDDQFDFEGRTPVRYCSADARSANHLLDIVAHAIAQWQPITHYSSASITPDMACRLGSERFNFKCLCGQQSRNGESIAPDTVVISDGQHGGDDPKDWTMGTYATLGYDPWSDKPGRHHLVFGAYNKYQAMPPRQGGYFDYMFPIMTHEFGHFLGLEHEHQHPDRDLYVEFRCQYLRGYDAVEIAVMQAENDKYFPKKASKVARMEQVCTIPDLAARFFPGVLAYLAPKAPLRELAHPDWLVHSEGYDYALIMTYSSYDCVRFGRKGFIEGNSPLVRKLPRDTAKHSQGVHGQPLWVVLTGGGRTWDKRISTMDVMRIAALYPGNEQQQADASKLGPDQQWVPLLPKIPLDNGRILDGRLAPNDQDVVNRQLERISDEIPRLSQQDRVATVDLDIDALIIGMCDVMVSEEPLEQDSGKSKGKSKWKNRLSWLGKKGKGKDDQGVAGSSNKKIRREFVA